MLWTRYVESGVSGVWDLSLRVVRAPVLRNRRSSDGRIFVRLQCKERRESWLRLLALTCNRIEGCPFPFTRPNAVDVMWRELLSLAWLSNVEARGADWPQGIRVMCSMQRKISPIFPSNSHVLP
jgi:hypothetical protein